MASTTSFQSPTSISFHQANSNSNSSSFSRPSSVSFRRPSTVRAAASTATAPASSLYEVLGVQDGATRREIREAYRKLARVLHPDVAAAANPDKDAMSAAVEFIRLHEAYATLSDPRKKFEYDRMILLKRHRINCSTSQATSATKSGTTSYSGFAGYTRRTWETDQCW